MQAQLVVLTNLFADSVLPAQGNHLPLITAAPEAPFPLTLALSA